jgi:hypothetical protein
LEAKCQQNLIDSEQKLPEESNDFFFKKQWKTKDNSPPQTVVVIPQAVGTGETDQFSPSLSLRSTTYRLQKQSGQRGVELISPVSTGPTTAVLVVLLKE